MAADQDFCAKWAKHFGIEITVQDLGTYSTTYVGDGSKAAVISQPLTEPTARQLYDDVGVLLASAGQDVGTAAKLLGYVGRAALTAGDRRASAVAFRLHDALDARHAGADLAPQSRGSVGGDWLDEE